MKLALGMARKATALAISAGVAMRPIGLRADRGPGPRPRLRDLHPDRQPRRCRTLPRRALPGTLTVRAYACGKHNCRCHADPPQLHGPYAEWTRKINGKTITRRLTPAELADWQPLFDNARKMRTLLAELQELTLAIIEATQHPGQ
jgi:hypothetical protein